MANKYIVYADGACSNNQDAEKRIGAYGAVIFKKVEGGAIKKDMSKLCPGSTNNQMELMGVIDALKEILRIDPEMPEVIIRSDSQYVVKGVTLWLEGWKAKGWKIKGGEIIKNKDMWVELDSILKKVKYSFEKVVGDGDNKWNAHCDVLARNLCGSKPKR